MQCRVHDNCWILTLVCPLILTLFGIFVQTLGFVPNPFFNISKRLWPVHPLIIKSFLLILGFCMNYSFLWSTVIERTELSVGNDIAAHECWIAEIFIWSSVFIRAVKNCMRLFLFCLVWYLFIYINVFPWSLVCPFVRTESTLT